MDEKVSIFVAIDDIMDDYNKEEEIADKMYWWKYLSTVWTVNNIDFILLETPTIYITYKNDLYWKDDFSYIACITKKSEEKTVESLKKWDTIEIVWEVGWKFLNMDQLYGIDFKDCLVD